MGIITRSFTMNRCLIGQDRHLRLSMKEGFLEALPISVLMTTISWQGAMTLLIVVCLHHFIWNQIHMEMHKPEKRFFSHWAPYKFLPGTITCITGTQTRTSMLFYRLQTMSRNKHSCQPIGLGRNVSIRVSR